MPFIKGTGMEEMPEELKQAYVEKVAADARTNFRTTDELLEERGKEYGDFRNHAIITQTLEQTFFTLMLQHNKERAIKDFTPIMREGAHMIFHKLGRIANGNPKNIDSWEDIAGYAKLVADELRKEADFNMIKEVK